MDGGHDATGAQAQWRLRPLILATVGAAAALAVQQLVARNTGVTTPVPVLNVALATALATMALALGFTLERRRAVLSVLFAVLIGTITGLIFYWHGEPGWGLFSDWRLASLILSIGVATPLFQVARDEGGWRFPYAEVHGHAWTDVVLWFACWTFVGVVFALAWLLAALFDLIGLHVLRDLLDKDWFDALLVGASFGGALGVFRERDAVVRLLQRVVTAVLAVLAPVLGIGLIVFLVALPFTGLGALWDATKSTTPILLGCVVGALILANAVIGNGEEEEATNPVLCWGAMALALAMLPLAVIAAVATGLRIGQYGCTPDRLWALVFVILACAYGLAYLVALARGRMAWAPLARSANLTLAFIVCALALFLATPLLSFNAISTADQVARLESGRIPPARFDWAALAFDFGDPGKAALKRLSGSANSQISIRARRAFKTENRWELASVRAVGDGAAALAKRVRLKPSAVPLPEGLLLSFNKAADEKGTAVLWYEAGASSAVLVTSNCDTCQPDITVSRRDAQGDWKISDNVFNFGGASTAEDNRMLSQALARGEIDLRPVQRRQVFIGGKPAGGTFE